MAPFKVLIIDRKTDTDWGHPEFNRIIFKDDTVLPEILSELQSILDECREGNKTQRWIIIDEAYSLLKYRKTDSPLYEEISKVLDELSRLGREYRKCLIFLTNEPNLSEFTYLRSSLFKVKIMNRATEFQSKSATGSATSLTNERKLKLGRFYYEIDGGVIGDAPHSGYLIVKKWRSK